MFYIVLLSKLKPSLLLSKKAVREKNALVKSSCYYSVFLSLCRTLAIMSSNLTNNLVNLLNI